jgi:hypothetical protein
MSFLTNPYVVIPAIGLSVQIIVLALLLYGYWLNQKLMFPRHGRVMSVAVVLHLVVVFTVMIPSFVLAVIPEYVLTHIFGIVSLVSLIHVPLGTLAILLGVWLVISWRSQGLKGCFNRKRIMLTTMIVWLASLLLGITLYAIFYWSLLMA